MGRANTSTLGLELGGPGPLGRATSDSAHQQHQPEKYRDLNGGLPTLVPNELPELSNVCGDGTANPVEQLQEGACALPGVPERHAFLRDVSTGGSEHERRHTHALV